MKNKKPKNNGNHIFILIVALIAILVFMGMSVSKVIVQIYDKYNEASELELQLADLKDNEEKLESEINRLQDPEYLARYAREKYFYSKENELIIRIPEKEDGQN
jgi:cell division protein DivIC